MKIAHYFKPKLVLPLRLLRRALTNLVTPGSSTKDILRNISEHTVLELLFDYEKLAEAYIRSNVQNNPIEPELGDKNVTLTRRTSNISTNPSSYVTAYNFNHLSFIILLSI